MRYANTLRALMAVGAAIALTAPAVAAPPSADHDFSRRPAMTNRGPCDRPSTPSGSAELDREGSADRVVGQIVAIDAPSGVVMLATQSGMVALRGEPETMADLDVGDIVVVEVSLEDDARDPRGGPDPRDSRSARSQTQCL